MDGYACSSWYLLRFADPNNSSQAWSSELANYWAPVDFYVGGDHAVAHLLYVRFWTHVFKDLGLTNFAEPVKKLVYHGYINAEDGTKMSKSKGNTIDPIEVIDQGYGADTLRTYEMFIAPYELDAAWDPRGIAGVYRFLNRVWVLTQEFLASDKTEIAEQNTNQLAKLRKIQHKTIKKVAEDFRRESLNTAVASLMEMTNELYKLKLNGFSSEWREVLINLYQLMAPFAPHLASELWEQIGGEGYIDHAKWPKFDEKFLKENQITIIVQVNGKLRARINVAADAGEGEVLRIAKAEENVIKHLEGKEIIKEIFVEGKLVSLVVK
jgi:leucyl-tRNA synthetase